MSDWTARIPLKVPCLQTTDAGQHTQTRIACAHRYYYTLFSYLYVFYMIYLLYIAYNVYIYIFNSAQTWRADNGYYEILRIF